LDSLVQPSIEIDESALDLSMTGAAAWIVGGVKDPLEVCDLHDVIREMQESVLQDLPSEESAGYAELLTRLNYPKTKPAGMRLRETIQRRGLRQWGLLVDAVNVVSARHAAGIGLHRIEEEDLDPGSKLVIWRADGTEIMVPAFTTEAKNIPSGDLLYGWQRNESRNPIAWLGKKDVDSADRQIDSATTRALLVVLGYPNATAEYSANICASIIELIRLHRPDASVTPLSRSGPGQQVGLTEVVIEAE
jgi:DNA/RNA-binding domain of Phe-tRNA-synthetase-like protein